MHAETVSGNTTPGAIESQKRMSVHPRCLFSTESPVLCVVADYGHLEDLWIACKMLTATPGRVPYLLHRHNNLMPLVATKADTNTTVLAECPATPVLKLTVGQSRFQLTTRGLCTPSIHISVEVYRIQKPVEIYAHELNMPLLQVVHSRRLVIWPIEDCYLEMREHRKPISNLLRACEITENSCLVLQLYGLRGGTRKRKNLLEGVVEGKKLQKGKVKKGEKEKEKEKKEVEEQVEAEGEQAAEVGKSKGVLDGADAVGTEVDKNKKGLDEGDAEVDKEGSQESDIVKPEPKDLADVAAYVFSLKFTIEDLRSSEALLDALQEKCPKFNIYLVAKIDDTEVEGGGSIGFPVMTRNGRRLWAKVVMLENCTTLGASMFGLIEAWRNRLLGNIPGRLTVFGLGAIEHKKQWYVAVLMEYCPINLKEFIKTPLEFQKHCGTEQQLLRALLQIGEPVRCLHVLDIMHRDLKPANIGVSVREDIIEYFLFDFWTVRKDSPNENMTIGLGTYAYMPPEMFQSANCSTDQKDQEGENLESDPVALYDKRIDIFSLGIVYFELATKKIRKYKNTSGTKSPPLLTKNEEQLLWDQVTAGRVSNSICNLILRMVNEDREKRPSMVELYVVIEDVYQKTILRDKNTLAREEEPKENAGSNINNGKEEPVASSSKAANVTKPAEVHPSSNHHTQLEVEEKNKVVLKEKDVRVVDSKSVAFPPVPIEGWPQSTSADKKREIEQRAPAKTESEDSKERKTKKSCKVGNEMSEEVMGNEKAQKGHALCGESEAELTPEQKEVLQLPVKKWKLQQDLKNKIALFAPTELSGKNKKGAWYLWCGVCSYCGMNHIGKHNLQGKYIYTRETELSKKPDIANKICWHTTRTKADSVQCAHCGKGRVNLKRVKVKKDVVV